MMTYNFSQEAASQQCEHFYHSILQMQRDTGHRLYLLTDPVLLLQRTDTPFVQTLVSHQPTPVPLPHTAMSEADYPWLIALDTDNEDHLAVLRDSIAVALEELHPDLLCQGSGRGICGWITSDADPADLIKQLGHTAIQKQPDNNPLLLRYYDPAVHNLLWDRLSELQQRRMAGVMSGWLLPDGDAQVVVRRFQPAPMLYSTFSLGLNAQQCEFILHVCGIANRALRQYRLQHAGLSRYYELTAASHILHVLERQSQHPALQLPADKERLALKVLQYHPDIDQHPKIAELLDYDAFSDDVTWSQRTRAITPESWQRYARELAITPPMENPQ